MIDSSVVEEFMHRFIPYNNDDKAAENLFLSYIYLKLSNGSTLDDLNESIVKKLEDHSTSVNDIGLSILGDFADDYMNMKDSVYTEKIQRCVAKFENECTGKSEGSFMKAELATCARLADLLVANYDYSLFSKKQRFINLKEGRP